MLVKDHVRAAALLAQLGAHAVGRQHRAATQAGRFGAGNGTIGTSLSLVGWKISNSTRGVSPFLRMTLGLSAFLRLAFLLSQNERMSGISAPQLGDSHRTVRAHR